MKNQQGKIRVTFFSSPVGVLGLAWNEKGIVALQLPEKTKQETQAKLLERAPEAIVSLPDSWVREIIELILSHLKGERQDFSKIPLDLSGVSLFARQVYRAARKIKPGEIKTYGELAKAIGKPKAFRAVGQVLGSNPIALIVPCHRILAASGKIGGFSAYGGPSAKRRLLAIEGVIVEAEVRGLGGSCCRGQLKEPKVWGLKG